MSPTKVLDNKWDLQVQMYLQLSLQKVKNLFEIFILLNLFSIPWPFDYSATEYFNSP